MNRLAQEIRGFRNASYNNEFNNEYKIIIHNLNMSPLFPTLHDVYT